MWDFVQSAQGVRHVPTRSIVHTMFEIVDAQYFDCAVNDFD